ncbi:MAG: tyrosine-type recombinase/integrase [Chloroflexota bacterium]|nr:tyrosine-type recombinase/integrase [Chloroflexota bacterium]
MRTQRGPRGQFSSLYGTSTLRLAADFAYPPGGPRYQRLVFDADGQLIVPLNEWYRLMEGVRAARTRETYLAVLRPWFGFMAQQRHQWNARPEAVREYTRLFLLDAGCALQTGSVEGWFVQATNKSPISTNGLHLLIASLRNFYTMMLRGVFDPQDQRFHPLYAYENPMYSKVLVTWRSEHRKWIRNAGAPDNAGIRSASRAEQARQPVGFFQVRRQPLEPPVARDSEPTRLAILAGVRYMIDHAPAREAVILRFLLESGARVSEVLELTAGGLRRAQNPKIGIDVAALVRNKGEHTVRKPIWCSAETREQLQRYIARERSQLDTQGRMKLEQLGDDERIFLSRRRRQLGYSGFRTVFNCLLGQAQRHFATGPKRPDGAPIALPSITPHTIRHLHTTFRVKKVRELFSSPAERERALEALVDDLGWRSAEMLKTYDHAVSRAELKELMASSVRQMLQDAPYDVRSLEALLRRGGRLGESIPPDDGPDEATILSEEARQTLAWIEALEE